MRAILALIGCLLAGAAPAAQLNLTVTVTGGSVGGDTPYTALHTYFMAANGNDSNDGLSAAKPWLTPNHAVACGDVIVAAAGAYSSVSFDGYGSGPKWATPTGCPSTSGGIDGKGGIYDAVLLCAKAFSCTIDATTHSAMFVNSSNWAVVGWQGTNSNNGYGECFRAQPTNGGNIAFVAFINDIAKYCPLAGFGSDGQPTNFNNSVDEFAVVGSIAFNASRAASYCGSGIGDNVPINVNTLAGTHVYFSQDFSYGNIDGACSVNSIYKGAFTTMAASAAVGAGSISVAAVSGWGVGWPIEASGNGSSHPFASPAIPISGPTPTLVSSVAGATVGLSNKVASPGLTSGQNVVVSTSTDGEGIIFDTWGHSPFTGAAAVENNILWKNGAHGYEMFCGATPCAAGLNVTVTQNTMYCDAQDYKRDGNAWEIYDSSKGSFPISYTNNLAVACVKQPYGSTKFAGWNGTSGVGSAGTGQPVVAGGFGTPGVTVVGNYFTAVAGVACPIYASCVGPNNDVALYNGMTLGANTLGVDPKFANPNSVPTTAPDCSAYGDVVSCMAPVVAALKSAAAPTLGYQPPAAGCQADPLYPTWLKGIVYLQWTGSAVVQKHGLVTTPCGL